MHKLIAPIALLVATLLPGQAQVAHWIWFTVTGGAVAYDEQSQYIDVATGLVGVDTVTFYQKPHQIDGVGDPYSFLAERLEFECRGNRYRWSNSAAYDKDGASINSRDDGDWTEMGAELGSPALYRRIMCNNDRPPSMNQAADIAGLFKAMTGATAPIPYQAIATTTPSASSPPSATAPKPAPATTAAVTTPPKPAAFAPMAGAATASPAPAKTADAAKTAPKTLDMDALAASLAVSAGLNAPAPAPTPTPTPKLRP